MSAKRSWKLQEFVAHSANVTCLAIGPSSGRVMVTGGEDKKVNMWAIGKPNVILSLPGHTTPIECVQFNNSEELVCAGSQSGALKIWDLEAAKVVRTLTGHKANIKSLDFHPYGEFIASGSMDTTVRLWDIRRKGCIVSYKGHTKAINHLRFSPDGRWVISAGEDGIVKLWDLNAGKLLADFSLHTGPVNRVEFHPREFLVATGSSDRTVKFWDLETFGLISSTEVQASAVRTVSFHPEGLCLFSAGHDSLRAYLWEPNVCFDAQTLGWGKVADISYSSNQLIGASFQQTNVSVWVSTMNNLEGMLEKAENTYVGKVEINQSVQKTDQILSNRKHSPPRKSFPARPKTQSSKSRKESQQDADNFKKAVEDKLNDPTINYDNIFQPKSALSRSPESQRRQEIENNKQRLQEEASTDDDNKQKALNNAPQFDDVPPVKPISVPTAQPVAEQPKLPVYHPPLPNQQPFQPPLSTPETDRKYPEADESEQFPVRYQQPQRQSQQQQRPSQQQQRPITGGGRPNKKQPAQPISDQVQGLSLNDFAKVERQATPNDEESTLAVLNKSHSSLCQIMQARLQNLSLVSRLWTEGDIKASIETASSMSDLSVFVDLMNVLVLKPTLWNLDLCGVVLPQIKNLLSSNYESYVETASSTLKLVLKNFSQLIKNTLSSPPSNLGVDLSREERYQKCSKCHETLVNIRHVVSSRTQSSGRVGSLCRELSLALIVID